MPIFHVVLFSLKDSFDAAVEEQVFGTCRGWPGKIPGVLSFRGGRTFTTARAQGYTHAIIVQLEDLQGYLDHPLHKAIVKQIAPHANEGGPLAMDFEEEPLGVLAPAGGCCRLQLPALLVGAAVGAVVGAVVARRL